MWWETLLAVLGGLVLLYAVLLILLWTYARKHPETVSMKDALRLLPDLLRLIKRLADDVVVVALVLRSVIRHAGVSALERHWPGTPEGLHLIKKLVGTTAAP